MTSFFEPKNDWERLYRELGRLIETMPPLDPENVTPKDLEWMAAAYALVTSVGAGAGMDAIQFTSAMDNLCAGTVLARQAPGKIRALVYRALGIAQQNAPASAAGSFIPSGGTFDAFAALAKVFKTAGKDVLLIDAYMDETALTDFATAVPEGVTLRLLADRADHKPTLQPAAQRWQQQYGAKRPLQLRLASPKSLHDRAIFIDGKEAWLVSQSLNAIVKRSPATITRADIEVASAKLAAYEATWNASQVVHLIPTADRGGA